MNNGLPGMSDLYNNSAVASWPVAVEEGRSQPGYVHPIGGAVEEQLLALFDVLHQPALRYAISFGLERQDAEDVLQEVFLALFQHLVKDKPKDNLRSWVFRVTHNLALKRRMLYGKQGCSDSELNADMSRWADPSPGPEEALLFTERQMRLRRVLEALPDKDQACLRLRAEGLRYREIARVLGISLGAVASSIVRGLERLERAG